jgi:heptosyltransferase-2
MKTLVVSPNWLGDALMAQPLLAALKKAGAGPLDVLAPRALEALFRAMPEIDAVIPTDFAHGRLQWGERMRLARALRAAHYQRAIVLPNSFKSALIVRLAAIEERVGYVGERRGILLNQTQPTPGRDTPMVERYLRLSGLNAPPGARPELAVSPQKGAETIARHGLDPERPLYALCPGAEYGPAKRWPARHFAALADSLHEREPESQIVILGSANDRPIATDITSQASAPLVDLSGRTTLEEAIAMIAACHGVVSNDSGLMHVAAALGRAQVAVFGSSDPRHTPPMSARAQVVWLHLECSPCFARECPLGHLRCLNEIAPDTVRDALERSLTTETV